MGIFRSEEMCLKKIRIPRENAVEILTALGSLEDCVEFMDLTTDEVEGKKNFALMIKRCEELDKKIGTIERYCEDYNQQFNKYSQYHEFLSDLANDKIKRDRVFGSTYFDLVETEVIEEEKRLNELIDSQSQITENLETLIEKKYVLLKSSQMIANEGLVGVNLNQNMIEEGITSNIHFLAGVIKAEEELKMKRMVFRISRGRALSTFWDFDLTEEELFFTSSAKIRKDALSNLKKTGEDVSLFEAQTVVRRCQKRRKKIFTIIFQGGEENYLLSKMLKICDIFHASRYSVPKPTEINQAIDSIEKDIKDKKHLTIRTEQSIRDFLGKIIDSPENPNKCGKYALYRVFFKQEKMVFHNLNKCILRDTFIDGEVWIPTKNLEKVQSTLRDLFPGRENMLTANLYDPPVGENPTPPTYIPSNDFLWAFQEIVDIYGIPRYQEINPVYFNIVTFPFLFGIMFGDIGHGFLVLVLGLFLCIFNEKIKRTGNSPLKPVLKGRYLLLLMGFFAFYAGWIYNDFFSIPIELGSCYKNHPSGIAVKEDSECVYPFGIDPKWYSSKNELSYFNSLKMKLSVIIGVSHMLLGIFLRGWNSVYFGKYLDFIFQFIPQLIFMGILFGYMNVMIFIKWYVDWTGKERYAPNLISQLMNIFLKFGSVANLPLWGKPLETGGYVQEWFHFGILLTSIACIPIMLLPKTIIEYHKLNKKQDFPLLLDMANDYDNFRAYLEGVQEEKEKHSFSELFVHQIIETIEFVLGTISNTASYLRLWALSLAHSQLSKVFFEKTILMGIKSENVIIGVSMIIPLYFIFASVTFFVLLCMDLMECFLHTLRLHWVEFQNKFYKADGYKFNPFCFRNILHESDN